MTAATTGDWVYWLLAGAIGFVGVVILYFALLHDRSRGRKRCPRCWYDMSGTLGLTCSECGKSVQRERRLFKTRRHKRWAAVGLLLLLIVIPLARLPQLRAHGWRSLVPTTVLVAVTPWLNLDESVWIDELVARISREEIAEWQWEWFTSWGLDDGNRLFTPNITTRDQWVRDVPLRIKFGAAYHSRLASPIHVTVTPIALDGSNATFSRHPFAEAIYGERDLQYATQYTQSDLRKWMLHAQTTIGRRSFEWTSHFEHAVSTVYAIEQVMNATNDAAVASQITDHTSARFDGDYLYISLCSDLWEDEARRMRCVNAISGVTLAFRVELRYRDVLVADGETFFEANCEPSHLDSGFYFPLRNIPLEQEAALKDDPSGWTIRLTDSPELALCDFESDTYLAGEVTLPVDVSDAIVIRDEDG